ncbi:MAG: trypsin-like peptidase domain-containing protein [Armatimonadota bacterium]
MIRHPLRLLTLALLLVCCASAWAQFTEAAGKIRDAVVTVAVQNRTGTGFIVNSDGSMLTNKHVVGEAKSVTVKLRNGDQVTAQVVKAAEARDVCLLKLDRQHLPAVQFASSAKLKQGQAVAAMGAPFGLEGSLTKGVVSAVNRDIDGQKFIQIDAALNQGNSGGPIINEDGVVVGMATKAAKEAQNVGFAIPSDELMSFLSAANVSYEAALGEAPKAGESPAAAPETTAPAPDGASPASGSPVPPPAPVPAAPPSPLSAPWVLLVAAAVVAFVVALITALLVAGKKTTPVIQQPVQYTYAQPIVQQPMVTQQQPVRPAAPPPAEDLSDIDIELR